MLNDISTSTVKINKNNGSVKKSYVGETAGRSAFI